MRLKLHALGWTIKGFFLPLLFAYLHNGLVAMWDRNGNLPLGDYGAFIDFIVAGFYLFDVLLAAVAYSLTLRLLDSHIRSVEPSVFGWAICLICYEPFVNGTLRAYFHYDKDNLYWGAVFAPFLASTWPGAPPSLRWSGSISGQRSPSACFSNLTNRGIITSGPYRWVKHPAYLAKNLSWWLSSVPFVAGAGWVVALQSCAMLLCVNLVYYLRARTEERHLRADPAYRDYEAFIAAHGLFAVLARAVARPRGQTA